MLVVLQAVLITVEVPAKMPLERQTVERRDPKKQVIVLKKDFLTGCVRRSVEFLRRMVARLVNLARVTPDARTAVKMHEVARELDFVIELNCDALETHRFGLDEIDGYRYEDVFYIRDPVHA